MDRPSATEDEHEMLVLCGSVELEEEGETLRVGDDVERFAGRRRDASFGDGLDEVEWELDRYAEAAGIGTAVVSGRIAGIDAVFVRLERHPDGWRPRPGSALLEPIASTAETRVIEHEIAWGPPSPSKAGGFWAAGYPVHHDGDEWFSCWLIRLADARIDASASA